MRYRFASSGLIGCHLACFKPGQPALGPYPMFDPPPTVVDLSSLFRRVGSRHSRRSRCQVIRHRLYTSTSLPPLAPRALPRFPATMDALTPARRFFGPRRHERRSGPGRSPCFSRAHFQSFCPQPPRRPSHGICARSHLASARDHTPADRTSWLLKRRPRTRWPLQSTGLTASMRGPSAQPGRRFSNQRLVLYL